MGVSLHSMIDYYNEQYKTQGIRDAEASYRRILSLLKVKERETVLDVSCGEGILEYVAENKGIHAVGWSERNVMRIEAVCLFEQQFPIAASGKTWYGKPVGRAFDNFQSALSYRTGGAKDEYAFSQYIPNL